MSPGPKILSHWKRAVGSEIIWKARANPMKQVVPLLIAWLLLAATSARANSYASGPPLVKAPAPEDVFAFASDPPCPTPRQNPPLEPSRVLLQEDFMRFLQDGVIEPDPSAIANVSDGNWCRGYFFTNDGTPYWWALWSRHLLSIGTGDRGCLLRLRHSEVKSVPAPMDSEDLPPLTKPPEEKDLFAFVTDLYPSTGGAFPLSKKNLRHFLREGKHVVFQSRSEFYDIASSQRFTPSPELAKRISEFIAPVDGSLCLNELDLHCEGALVTRDRHIYFWKLLGDTALELTSPTGEKCILLLPEKFPIQAPSLR